ncbi:hypothetical protein AB6A40_004695 [Gnathostoma spinigerum]|uniref:Uncharacterized protein n=1 Tax=Gnathostoma spinigerum TaxID=75299 RepID=A0ABD6EFK0_9BILA
MVCLYIRGTAGSNAEILSKNRFTIRIRSEDQSRTNSTECERYAKLPWKESPTTAVQTALNGDINSCTTGL